MKKKIYLDHAASTPIDPRVERVVLKYMKIFGNPSSLHEAGRQAKKVLEDSRRKVAKVLNCRPEEIIFTGSGTESANLAIFGVVRAYKQFRSSTPQVTYWPRKLENIRIFDATQTVTKFRSSTPKFGGHIITTKIEHHAVLRACQYLESHEGFEVTYLDVKPKGVIDLEAVRKALRPDTILVSIMYANNEIGTIQPISEISKLLKNFRNRKSEARNSKSEIRYEKIPFFHTDACQTAGALNLNVNQLGVDLMTLNGSKICGPKGVGCLYVRRGINLAPMVIGGNQERGLRAGTENVPAIAGFAEALKIADKKRTKESARFTKLRDYLIKNILDKIPGSHLNGDPVLRLPNNINVSFEGVDPERSKNPLRALATSYGASGEILVLALDQKGIQVSTGAACTTTETGPSHVLQALQRVQDKQSKNPALSQKWLGNIRITLGRQTTKKEVEYLLRVLPLVVKKLRGFSK